MSLFENHHDGPTGEPTLPDPGLVEYPSAPVWDEKDLTDEQIEAWVAANGNNSCVQLVYKVPVLVEVDLLTARVTRVREVVEETAYDGEVYATPDTLVVVGDKRIAELALTIAEDTGWPAWEAKF